ncbi:hypothetical protein AB0K60_07135 [Thermopolyspora sp. NPDC052614]|uniref:hypothetical protein n=1 Tax=Thermopolyspora sp. NPDC052614 TaxID=3155682 RepID=UPI0034224933
MPLIPSDYNRADLQRIARDESARAAQRSEQGHTWAARQHEANADEALTRIANRQYGRRKR